MTTTNRNNLGVFIFVLSGTALSHAHANESGFNISYNHDFKKEHYISPRDIFSSTVTGQRTMSAASNNYMDSKAECRPEESLLQFANNLIKNNKDLEPDFAEIVERRFWDMI